MAKLTEAEERAYFKFYGEHFAEHIGPCPWNPFPLSSPWGKLIEEKYRINEKRRRAEAGRRALEEQGR